MYPASEMGRATCQNALHFSGSLSSSASSLHVQQKKPVRSVQQEHVHTGRVSVSVTVLRHSESHVSWHILLVKWCDRAYRDVEDRISRTAEAPSADATGRGDEERRHKSTASVDAVPAAARRHANLIC